MVDARVSQNVVEVAELTTTQKARVTQNALEVLELPTTQKARVTQNALEVLIFEGGLTSPFGPILQVI